jgi:hypothetical protein
MNNLDHSDAEEAKASLYKLSAQLDKLAERALEILQEAVIDERCPKGVRAKIARLLEKAADSTKRPST